MRAVDTLLIASLPKAPPTFLLTGLDGDGGVGLAAASRYPSARTLWFHFDLFAAGLASFQGLDAAQIAVAPDLAGALDGVQPDVIAFSFPRGAESLLGREIIEESHDALAPGGKLFAATDGNPEWLKRVVREIFRNAECTTRPTGAVVTAVRTREATASKDHSHVVQMSDRGRNFEFRTRPGVFSYGHIDQGSKALLAVADLDGAKKILDIGCGVGVLGIVAAAANPGAVAVLIDANVRAVALARENALRNGVPGVSVVASAEPILAEGGPFDCVLANPPYFANFKIAIRFIAAAHEKLAPGGRLWLVAKAADEHAARVRQIFGNAEVTPGSEYGVVCGRR